MTTQAARLSALALAATVILGAPFSTARAQAPLGVCLPSNDASPDGWGEVQRRLGPLAENFEPLGCDGRGLLVQMGALQVLVQLGDVPMAARPWVVAHALEEQWDIRGHSNELPAPGVGEPPPTFAVPDEPEAAPPTFRVPESPAPAAPTPAVPVTAPTSGLEAPGDAATIELRPLADLGRSRHAMTLRLGYLRGFGSDSRDGADVVLRYRWRRLVLGVRARWVPREHGDSLEAASELGLHAFDIYFDRRHRFRLQGQVFAHAGWSRGRGVSCDPEDDVCDSSAGPLGGASTNLGLAIALSRRFEIGVDAEAGVRFRHSAWDGLQTDFYYSTALTVGLRFGTTS